MGSGGRATPLARRVVSAPAEHLQTQAQHAAPRAGSRYPAVSGVCGQNDGPKPNPGLGNALATIADRLFRVRADQTGGDAAGMSVGMVCRYPRHPAREREIRVFGILVVRRVGGFVDDSTAKAVLVATRRAEPVLPSQG